VLDLMTLRYPLHFVDIETTSLDVKRGDIIAIAIISESQAGERSSWYTLVKPNSLEAADYMSLKIAGYTVERWRDAPSFDSVAPLVYEFLKEGTIIAHNAQFDVSFIKAALSKCMLTRPPITHRVICTRQLMIEHSPTDSASLQAARDLFGLGHLEAHNALDDAKACRHVFKRLWRCGPLRRVWLRALHKIQTKEKEIATAQRR